MAAAAPIVHDDTTARDGAVRGIFFDLDDTLIGYAEAERSALAAGCALAARLNPAIDEDRLAGAIYAAYATRFEYGTPGYRRLATLPTRELRRTLTVEALMLLDAPDDGGALTEALMDAYEEAEASALKAFPGARETLEALRPHFTLGLITNGPGPMQRGKLAALALDGFFDVIVVDTEFGHPKPDARIFAHAAAAVSLPAESLLFVGNSLEADIAGANGSGWTSVWMRPEEGVPFGSAPAAAPRPHYVISRLSDLLTLPPVAASLPANTPKDRP